MYDLLVLGSLMTGVKSGYKLQKIVGSALQPIRKVSSGTLYPTLVKLEEQGLIVSKLESVGRKVKLMQITDEGITRFQELMAQTVRSDAKRNDIFHFKLRMIDQVSSKIQLKILQEFRAFIAEDLNVYQAAQQHIIEQRQQNIEQAEHFNRIASAQALDIQIAKTKLRWIDAQLEQQEK